MRRKKRLLRVYMQVRPVRMKESRYLAPSSPDSLGYTASIILGQYGSDCIQTSRDRFSEAGKTILGIVFRSFPKNDRDPSMRTGHSQPELNEWSPIPASRGRLSGNWIGSPAGIPGGRAASRF